MNREEFLKNFNDKEMATKIANDLEMALEYEMMVVSQIFVTPNIWKKLASKYEGINIAFLGHDRKQICFYPQDYEPYFEYDVLEIKVNNKFREYTHKDFLGSIMGLNIKRELIGDIFVIDGVGYVYVLSKISEYIQNNLTSIGKNECKVSITDKRDFSYDFSEVNINISSNRLDNFVSGITNLSRNKAIEYIEQGLVMLDYDVCKKKDKAIGQNSILTIRKYGKFLVYEELEDSKKGKKRWRVRKYK